jgi:hypothetical protein
MTQCCAGSELLSVETVARNAAVTAETVTAAIEVAEVASAAAM